MRQQTIRTRGFKLKTRLKSYGASTGFSLVEIMVGMVIALLGILIIMQVTTSFEAQKRSTTGGDEATNTGAIAIYHLQRSLRQAGYGINAMQTLNCNLTVGAANIMGLGAVTINHPLTTTGVDVGTDTLLVIYGDGNGSPEGDGITAQVAGVNNVYQVQTAVSFSVQDMVIAAPKVRATPCALSLDTVTALAVPDVTVQTGAAGMEYGVLYNMGQSPRIVGYAVRGGSLTQCNFIVSNCTVAANWTPIASNVVSLRAQYGKKIGGAINSVNRWDQIQPATACEWIRTLAVRFALVIRNPQFERNPITGDVGGVSAGAPAPSWIGSTMSTDSPAAVPIDVSADANWQNYRYRVLQTIAPLRNTRFAGGSSGCP